MVQPEMKFFQGKIDLADPYSSSLVVKTPRLSIGVPASSTWLGSIDLPGSPGQPCELEMLVISPE